MPFRRSAHQVPELWPEPRGTGGFQARTTQSRSLWPGGLSERERKEEDEGERPGFYDDAESFPGMLSPV